MPLIVHTARLDYRGPDRFDVTRAGGGDAGHPFAPSWPLVREGKRLRDEAGDDMAKLDAAWSWYPPRYLDEMRASYRRHRSAWDALLGRDIVTAVCFCTDAARCHRRLLAGILAKLGAVDDGERVAAVEQLSIGGL